MDKLLSVEAVHSGYATVRVLHDVSFSLPAQSTLALLGRNGVGKTTLIETIMGLTAQTGGRIVFKGKDVSAMQPHHRNQMGMALVPQQREIFRSLTVEENLKVAARPGEWTIARIYDFFPRLYERRGNGGGQLSGGEQQMLAMGRALAGNPSLLLLDEPFEGLAPVIVDLLVDAINRIRTEGAIASIVVEHHVDLALEMAETAIVLDRGRVSWGGSSRELKAAPDLMASLIGLGAEGA
ncbi:ABC transporter ATP-binding protein [Neorhizobium petrolearium]|uniref:ABC transporter ATP-binding protein n=1 Tax=Neorhizobium petrolearium TaxID=515361 RepID=UPI003F14A0D6